MKTNILITGATGNTGLPAVDRFIVQSEDRTNFSSWPSISAFMNIGTASTLWSPDGLERLLPPLIRACT